MTNINEASNLIREQIQSAKDSMRRQEGQWNDTRTFFDSERYNRSRGTLSSSGQTVNTTRRNRDSKDISPLEIPLAIRYESDYKSLYPDGVSFAYSKLLNSTRQGKLMTALKDKQAEDNKWEIAINDALQNTHRYNHAMVYVDSGVIDNKFSVRLSSLPSQNILIDPRTKGNDLHTARYIGFKGIIKTKADLMIMMKREKTPDIVKNIKSVIGRMSNSARNSPTPTSNVGADQNGDSEIIKQAVQGEIECYRWFYFDVGTNKVYTSLATVDNQEIISYAPIEKEHALPDSMRYPLAHLWANVSEIDFWGDSPFSTVKSLIISEKEAIVQQLVNGRRTNNPSEYVKSNAIEDLAQFKNPNLKTKLMSPNFDARADIFNERIASITNSDFITQAISNIKNNVAEVSSNLSGQNARRRQSVADLRNAVEQNRRRFKSRIDAFQSFMTDIAHLFVSNVVVNGTPEMLIKEVGIDGQEISSIISKSELIGVNNVNSAVIDVDVSFESEEIKLIEQKEKEAILGAIAEAIPNKREVMRQMLSGRFPTDTVEDLLSTTTSEASSAVRRDVQEVISGNDINPPTNIGFDYISEFGALIERRRYHLSDKKGNLTKEGKMVVNYFKKLINKLLEVDGRDLFEDELDRVYKAITQTDNPAGKIDVKALFANQQTTTQSS